MAGRAGGASEAIEGRGGLRQRVRREKEKMRGDPEQERLRLLGMIELLKKKRRAAFQDQRAEGLMSLGELRDRLPDVEDRRAGLEEELEATKESEKKIARLERDKEAVIIHGLAPWRSTMEKLTAHDRRSLYKRYGVKAMGRSGGLEITGNLFEECVDRDSAHR